MNRRAWLVGIAGAAAAMSLARAQPSPVRRVGFLRSTGSTGFAHLIAAFRQGLGDEGFEEGRNLVVEYRWADNDLGRLPRLADELIALDVAVIVGNSQAAEAARHRTSRVPIVFVAADDPVRRGLVASLGRPGGNLTGTTFFGGGVLGAKRYDLLREMVPTSTVIGFLMDPSWPTARDEVADVEAAARASGRRVVVAKADSPRELERAFASLAASKADAVIIGGSPEFTGARREIVALAARHALPAIYDQRDFVDAGGLMSYGGSFVAAYRQAGEYAGRILKGARPADLPVLQPATFSLTINLAAARALKIDVPQALRLRAESLVE